ncbi:MAG: galactose-1-phosphate uridylyltransferase, partial [Acidimicrobiales bacterium]
MSQLRLDPLTGRWVVISTDRAERPQQFTGRKLEVEADPDRPCPFCAGNEEATPPALETYGPSGRWLVRIVPNLFPAFSGNDPMAVEHLGPIFEQAPASGIHEVLVLSPGHESSWSDLADPQAGLVMAAIRDRMEEHASVPGLRYTQAIVNAGREAGASLEHPHGQLLGMPFVPGEIIDEQAGFARFAGACLLCTTLEAEEEARHRLVYADERVVVVAPYWSGTPYEMLVVPRTHEAHLHEAKPADLVGV